MAIVSRVSPGLRRIRDALLRAPSAVPEAVDRQMGRGAFEISRAMREGAPKAHSNLVNSISPEHVALLTWRVGAHVEHAWYAEKGRRPGGPMPPPQALADWAQTKLGISDPGARARAGFLIARKIQREGFPAQPFVQPVREDARWAHRLQALANQGLAQGLRGAGVN